MLGFFIDSLQHGAGDYETFIRNLRAKRRQKPPRKKNPAEAATAPSVEQQLEQQRKGNPGAAQKLSREKPQDASSRTN